MARLARDNQFVFFSAGPIGDHVVLLDVASQFLKATGLPSTILAKHPNQFMDELAIGYDKQIQVVPFTSQIGKLHIVLLALSSMFRRNCYVLIFPVPAPMYLKLFAWYIRFFTLSRIVGVNLEGTRSFPLCSGYKTWLGKSNVIEMKVEPFTATAQRILTHLGYVSSSWVPELPIVYTPAVFDVLKVEPKKYIVMHLSSSGFFRSLPSDRWNTVIKGILAKTTLPIIFSGSKQDYMFIEECVKGLSSDRLTIAAGKIGTQELLTLYKEAAVVVTVQTGNGLIINMLHVPTVVVNIKGTAMFDYLFNKKAVNLYSNRDCTCNPFETECTLLPYKGRFYMACLFNIDDKDIVDATVRLSSLYYEK